MPDSLAPAEIRIERLSGDVQRLKDDLRDVRVVQKELDHIRHAIENLQRETASLAAMVSTAKVKADEAAGKLNEREEKEEIEAKYRAKVAKWCQFVVGVVILVVTLWAGGVKATLENLVQFLREVKGG